MRELKLNLKPLLKKLEVNTKRKITSELEGSYMSSFLGSGLDFEGYREYNIGDDASEIDWKASLRTQEILVKSFLEERTLNVVFVFDVSSSMSYASTAKLKNEYAAELIATLSFAIIQSGDSAGMVMFTDHVVKSIYPAMGAKQYFIMLTNLSNPALYDGNKDYVKITSFLMNYLKRGTVIIYISDFIGLNEGWETSFEILSNKYDLIGIMIRDPNDNVLPDDSSQVVISDPFSEDELLINPHLVRQRYQEEVIDKKEQLKHIFSKTKSGFIELTTDKPFLDDLIAFLKKRHKR